MQDFRDGVEKSVLSNGLEVYSLCLDRPWEMIQFVVHAGVNVESLGEDGLAHLVEHCVSNSVARYPPETIKQFFRWEGGYVNLGEISYIDTRYKFRLPCSKTVIEKAVRIFGLMLCHSRLGAKLETEKEIVHEEFKRKYPSAKRFEWDLTRAKAIFHGHARLSRYTSNIGDPTVFLTAYPEKLQGFYDKYYTPANISVVGVGKLRHTEIIKLLESSPFATKKKGVRVQLPNFSFLPLPPAPPKMELRWEDAGISNADINGCKIEFVMPPKFHVQAVRIFSLMLDDVLFNEIRAKEGLSYRFDTGWTNHHDLYDFWISGSIHGRGMFLIEGLVRQCLDMIPKQRKLFEREKRKCLKLWDIEDLSGIEMCDEVASDLGHYQRLKSKKEYITAIRAVSFDDILSIAEFLTPDRQLTILVYP